MREHPVFKWGCKDMSRVCNVPHTISVMYVTEPTEITTHRYNAGFRLGAPTFSSGGAGSEERVVWQVCTLVGHPGKVSLVAFSPDGKRIVSGSIFYNTLQIWNAETGAEVSILE